MRYSVKAFAAALQARYGIDIAPDTVRWYMSADAEARGHERLVPAFRSDGGHARFSEAQLEAFARQHKKRGWPKGRPRPEWKVPEED